jgi:hypothetical protein
MRNREIGFKGADYLVFKTRGIRRTVGEFGTSHGEEIVRWGVVATIGAVAVVTIYEKIKHTKKSP